MLQNQSKWYQSESVEKNRNNIKKIQTRHKKIDYAALSIS